MELYGRTDRSRKRGYEEGGLAEKEVRRSLCGGEHACNAGTQWVEAGGSGVQDHL